MDECSLFWRVSYQHFIIFVYVTSCVSVSEIDYFLDRFITVICLLTKNKMKALSVTVANQFTVQGPKQIQQNVQDEHQFYSIQWFYTTSTIFLFIRRLASSSSMFVVIIKNFLHTHNKRFYKHLNGVRRITDQKKSSSTNFYTGRPTCVGG